MPSYLQMGHDSENLVGARDLNEFSGIILSPVNREPEKLMADVLRFRKISGNGDLDIVLDSQLYSPRINRGSLGNYVYFPSDIDSTTEMSSLSWWRSITKKLAAYTTILGVNSVTSPAFVPKVWTSEFYSLCADVTKSLMTHLEGTDIKTQLTLIVDLDQMGVKDSALRISSIVSEANPDGYYLVVNSDIPPRREIVGENELAEIMFLVKLLESTGKPVTVSHSSSDFLLFKAAGATNFATGKFFNLRRFSRSRYEEPSKGGRVIAYWFEESLLSFLRAADVTRISKRGFGELIGSGNSNNYWSKKIRDQWEAEPEKAWLALSWRHYLSWFSKAEQSLSIPNSYEAVNDKLLLAEENWKRIKGVLMDEPDNDGSWIRNWRQAMDEFSTRT